MRDDGLLWRGEGIRDDGMVSGAIGKVVRSVYIFM